jgi:type VI secretion system secreted protein Hcp
MLKTLIALSSAAAVFAVAPAAQAADQYFMKLDGVTGESVVGRTTDAIAVSAFTWGAENVTTIGSKSGGAGTGKASFNQLEIDKNVDATSPVLFERLTTGGQIRGMELVALRAGAKGPSIYMRYCFQPVFVSDVRHAAASGDEGIKETVTLTFGAVSEIYTKQDRNGAPAGNVFSSWSTTTNAASMISPDGNDYCAKSKF